MYVCGAQKQSSLAPPRVKRTQNGTEQKASEVKRRERRTREKERPTKKGRKELNELKKERASERIRPSGELVIAQTAVSEKRAEQSRAELTLSLSSP